MKIKMVQRKNPQKKSEVKYYASPVNAGKKTLRDIAKDIAGRSSLTRGDIENVLTNFMECLPSYLRDGFSVQLGELGTLRITLASNGAATKKEFHAESIKPRVIFRPSTRFMKRISDNHYEAEGKKKE